MLTFTEEMLLLLGDEEGELLPVREHAFECALAGAVLMDLAFEYRIDTDLQALVVTDPTPTGDPMLDRILAQIEACTDTTQGPRRRRAAMLPRAFHLQARAHHRARPPPLPGLRPCPRARRPPARRSCRPPTPTADSSATAQRTRSASTSTSQSRWAGGGCSSATSRPASASPWCRTSS